jgi:four helix bundle protein
LFADGSRLGATVRAWHTATSMSSTPPQRAADMLDALIARHPGRQLLHVSQMRRCLQSIAANISEGFGRGKGRDRNRSLEIARGETEEAIRHLSANYRTSRIDPSEYWPFHNLLVVIAKMLTSLLNH